MNGDWHDQRARRTAYLEVHARCPCRVFSEGRGQAGILPATCARPRFRTASGPSAHGSQPPTPRAPGRTEPGGRGRRIIYAGWNVDVAKTPICAIRRRGARPASGGPAPPRQGRPAPGRGPPSAPRAAPGRLQGGAAFFVSSTKSTNVTVVCLQQICV